MGVSAAYSFIQTTNGYIGLSSFEQRMITKVDRFTASGTFTVPAGVTFATAHITGGGGAAGRTGGGNGGASSVAFAGGTVTANGGIYGNGANAVTYDTFVAGADNSGQFARAFQNPNGQISGGAGAEIVAGGAVTPAATITVTVGAGGTAGTNGAAGGSGYVWIEYQVKA